MCSWRKSLARNGAVASVEGNDNQVLRCEMPPVTALICTRDRPTDVVRAAASILASENIDFELIVVDQSETQESVRGLELLGDPRLRVVRTRSRGLGAALNEGLQAAKSSIVIHTDDDCLVPSDWLARMALSFAGRPRLALVFGNVVAGNHDSTSGYVPTYVVTNLRLLRSPLATLRGRGIGASIGFRREAVLGVGGLDGKMGSGSEFKSSEDWDIELRVLLSDWEVMHMPDAPVVHFGYRSFADGRQHSRNDWYGMGACIGKLGHYGHRKILLVGLCEVLVHALLPPLGDLVGGRRPRGLQRVVGFLEGFVAGWTASVDKRSLTFL